MAQHGRYTVVRKLANGGMAEIFLASQQGHEGFQKPVVLKRILGAIYADPQFRNMLIDEAHISMSLTHSNIVQVLDLGLAGGRYFLVLELVDGWDLGYVLQRARAVGFPLPAGLGLFIVTEVCRALAYAHSKTGADGHPLGIVHRDVSPNNVLISEHGEVKLADFGIAKAMNKRAHTETGVVKGKVAFMSPEQGLGKPIDGRSDVFSLGTLLYVVSVGVKPFDAPTDLETLLRVQRADFKPPSRVRPDLGPEIESVITRAMRFLPDERYQTADQMLLDLERLLRSLHGGVGQTELKQYLAELGRRDGVPPIGRAQPVVEDQGVASGAELREGNAVVLADAQDELAEERTDLAEFMAVDGQSGPRLTRRTTDYPRATKDGGAESSPPRPGRRPLEQVDLRLDTGGREQTPPRSPRRLVEELSIPEGAADDAPPMRFRRRKSRAMPTLVALALLLGGGYAAARYFGVMDQILAAAGVSGEAQTDQQAPAPGPAQTAPSSPAGETPAVPSRTMAGKARPVTAPPARGAAPAGTGHPTPATPATAPSGNTAPPTEAQAPAAVPPPPGTRPAPTAAGGGQTPPPDEANTHQAGGRPRTSEAAARTERTSSRTKPRGTTSGSGDSRDVFKASAKRVRALSQGLDQLPPGTIQMSPPAPDPTPAP